MFLFTGPTPKLLNSCIANVDLIACGHPTESHIHIHTYTQTFTSTHIQYVQLGHYLNYFPKNCEVNGRFRSTVGALPNANTSKYLNMTFKIAFPEAPYLLLQINHKRDMKVLVRKVSQFLYLNHFKLAHNFSQNIQKMPLRKNGILKNFVF